MKNPTYSSFIIGELPNLIQIISFPAVISILFKSNAIGIISITILGFIVGLYLAEKEKRFFKRRIGWSIGATCTGLILAVLVVVIRLTIQQQ